MYGNTFETLIEQRNQIAVINLVRRTPKELAVGGSDFLAVCHEAETQSDEIQQWIDDEHERAVLRLAAARVERQVSPTTWQAFWCTASDGESVQDVADALDVSVMENRGTTKQRCCHAKSRAGLTPRTTPPCSGDSPLGQKDVLSIEGINPSLAELPASVHHDFVSDGLPRDRFNVRDENESEHVIAKPDGLHVTRLGTDGYSNTFVETLKRIHGNFEVTVSFKDLTIEPG